MQGAQIPFLLRGLRSHMPPDQKHCKIKQKQYYNKFNKDFLNGSHLKKKNLKKRLAPSLGTIFWETSVPWEWSGGRRECTGWGTEGERWGRCPRKLVHPWEPQKQNQGKPEAGTNHGLHACDLELLTGSGASLAILIASTSFERPALLVSKLPLFVLCPGPVILWTSFLLSCGWM